MLQAMTKLLTKSDILRLTITFAVCLGLWLIIEAMVQSARGRVAIPLIFAAIFVAVAYVTVHGLATRANKLLQGRCPHPLCHGTVHHSDSVKKGTLVCPTCKNKWPEVEGIKFRATGREH